MRQLSAALVMWHAQICPSNTATASTGAPRKPQSGNMSVKLVLEGTIASCYGACKQQLSQGEIPSAKQTNECQLVCSLQTQRHGQRDATQAGQQVSQDFLWPKGIPIRQPQLLFAAMIYLYEENNLTAPLKRPSGMALRTPATWYPMRTPARNVPTEAGQAGSGPPSKSAACAT